MKWIVPALIIGFAGGLLDGFTDLPKWICFLLGLGVFVVYMLVESLIKTSKIMKATKSKNDNQI